MNGLYHASCILHRVYFLYPFFERMIFMGKVGTRKRGKTSQYYFQLVSVDGTRKWKTGSGYRTKAEAQAATKQKTVLLSVKNGTFTVYDTRMSSPRQKIYNFFCSFSGSFIAAHSCFKWVFTVILPFRIP